jgi:DNA polymerase III epsilon subunit-like protein
MDLLSRRRFAVIDLETTGFSPVNDRIVEMACVVVVDGIIARSWSTLVNPQREIPRYATAVHGIRDIDVAHAPPLRTVEPRLREMCDEAVVVAHNASFDLAFLPSLQASPSLCTVQLARRVFPEAPNHKNQTLRAYLELDKDDAFKGLDAHRALSDALVTAGILLRCLERMRGSATPRPVGCAPYYQGAPIRCSAARLRATIAS